MVDAEWRPAIQIDPVRATFRNQSLLKLIAFAWRVQDYEVIGPEWMEQSRTPRNPNGH